MSRRCRRSTAFTSFLLASSLLASFPRTNNWIAVYWFTGTTETKPVQLELLAGQVRNDTQRRNLCTREQIQQGEWVPITLPVIPYIPQQRCLPDEDYQLGIPWKTWDWQPFAVTAGNCTLLRWNVSHFCNLVRFATISIVGDSLSLEQYNSLVQLLGQTLQEGQNQTVQHSTTIHYACKGQVRLVYVRDNYLSQIPGVLNEKSPDVLVINRGAHFVEDSLLESDLRRLATDLMDWQEKRQAARRPSHLFVRTSVPGHPRCWKFNTPAKSVREMEELVANLSLHSKRGRTKNWARFQDQNRLSLRVYHEANVSFDVLDGYSINILRPEEHLFKFLWKQGGPYVRDCLHSCYPGKMDVYNQLLLHFLERKGGVAAREADATWFNSHTL